MKFLIFCIIFYLTSLSLCHPSIYNVNRNETCYKPEPAKIYSWHIHLLYWQTNEEHTKGAYEVRDKFIKKFESRLGPICTDLFHQDQLCMFEPDRQPVGPFLTAQWSVFLMPEDFYDTVSWIIQNRNGYDVLVHPNTGCEVEDHSWWAMWSGNPWEIDLSVMSYDQPFPWPEKDNKSKNVTVSVDEVKEVLKNSEQSELVKLFMKEYPDH